MENEIIERRPYIHFKGRLYYVNSLVRDTETEEVYVAYQALYPPYGDFIRPLEDFRAAIDPKRPDNTTGQAYRFLLFKGL